MQLVRLAQARALLGIAGQFVDEAVVEAEIVHGGKIPRAGGMEAGAVPSGLPLSPFMATHSRAPDLPDSGNTYE